MSQERKQMNTARIQSAEIEFLLAPEIGRINILVPSNVPEMQGFTSLVVGETDLCLETDNGESRRCHALMDAIENIIAEIRVAVLIVVGERGPEKTRILKIRREQNVIGQPSGTGPRSMA